MSYIEALKKKAIDEIIAREGGYVNDSEDSGGETNFGITEEIARRYGYAGEMRELPREVAFDIYVIMFWHKLKLDDIAAIHKDIAEEVADTAVNMGVYRAADFLQRSLNVLNNRGKHYEDLIVDQSIGGITIEALGLFLAMRGKEGEVVLFNMLNSLQGAFLVELCERREKDEKFCFGWFKNRVGLK